MNLPEINIFALFMDSNELDTGMLGRARTNSPPMESDSVHTFDAHPSTSSGLHVSKSPLSRAVAPEPHELEDGPLLQLRAGLQHMVPEPRHPPRPESKQMKDERSEAGRNILSATVISPNILHSSHARGPYA